MYVRGEIERSVIRFAATQYKYISITLCSSFTEPIPPFPDYFPIRLGYTSIYLYPYRSQLSSQKWLSLWWRRTTIAMTKVRFFFNCSTSFWFISHINLSVVLHLIDWIVTFACDFRLRLSIDLHCGLDSSLLFLCSSESGR